MSLTEYYSPELCIYTVSPRKKKDDEYTLRKVQKDRAKLYTWLTSLLKQNEIVIFHIEDDIEINNIYTMKDVGIPLPDAPLTMVEYRGDQWMECHYLPVIKYPGKEPVLIHIDTVTKFILKNDNVGEIAQELYYRKK